MPPDDVPGVLGALAEGVTWSENDIRLLERDGQARLWWDYWVIDGNSRPSHRRIATGGPPKKLVALVDRPAG